eukprot:TRINITY_DN27048_c0_g1_i1.p1 TRINITY_DN27048_c0_g1~~TRINITY_DN27048_c0_g1_i1.p1  ORF type:complete len:359 (+),score=69.50 TRINITY_DN27048_c0_g1_i1:86-1162(+)
MTRGGARPMDYMPPGERQQLEKEVEDCDRQAEAARQAGSEPASQQQLLAQLERGLYLRRRLYAESSAEVSSACRRLCEACNCAATAMLQRGNLKAAHDLLKRAEQVSERIESERAITWNNLACYYRRTGKLRTAVSFLERALAIEEHTRNADAAQTHLNLCATLSQLNRHADALYHAQSALIRIYEILSPLMLTGKLHSGTSPGDESYEQVTVLCIAYHNLAVEHEYLKNYEAAVCNYAEGLRWAAGSTTSPGFLGQSHQLVGILRNSVDAVRTKLPPNSAALKRALELTDGATPAPAPAGPPSPAGKSMDHLLTPRGGSESQDRRAPSPGSPRSPRSPRSDRSRSRSSDGEDGYDSQ